MQTTPQNFKGAYPLAGERIGPAWRQLWSAITSQWCLATQLAAPVARETGLDIRTVENLLRSARAAGLIQVRYVKSGGKTKAEYRA